MKDISIEQAKELKTKRVFNVHVAGRNSGFVAKEVYSNGTIRWYPFYLRDSQVRPKYQNIRYIGTKNRKIPKTGFSTNPTTGFGFTSAQGVNSFFRFIDRNSTQIKSIIFTDGKSKVAGDTIFLSFTDFGKIRSRAKSFSAAKGDEEDYLIRNTLSQILPSAYKEPDKLVYFGGAAERFFEKYAPDTLTLSDEDANLLKSILLGAGISTEMVVSTKREIDRIYIEDVLKKFRELLKYKNDTPQLEEKWHVFFREHAWIFSQVFAYPAIFLRDKFKVGGQDLSGGTDKIIDFLYKNALTNNVAFIEIKTHKTKLMNDTPYRKPDIYSVSKDLSGAMVQVMDQKTKFLKNFHSLKGSEDVNSLNSSCMIVVGDSKMLRSKEKRDSFELFRSSNREVVIVTFDELLNKITTLLEIFTKAKQKGRE